MRVRNRKPTHPGEILKYDYLEPLNLSVTNFAKYIKVSRRTISMIINEKAGITADMALRLSKAFNTTPDLWLNLHKEYELWKAMNSINKEWETIPMINQNQFALI
ncbi:MAG: HigA family addiction module antidote protein [Desulfobacterales bacterium]|nr:HigA family addiction module antidote protein [Desulfobacterales bacterium]